jgi:hypothetical protein
VSGTYAINEVPATGDDRCRFAIPSTPGGWSTTPGANVALCYSHLLEELIASAPRLTPKHRSVRLLRCRLAADGGYELVERGVVAAVPEFEPRVPTRFAKTSSKGGALLDELMKGEGDGWSKATDEQVFTALRELCEQTHANGEEARQMSDFVACAVLLRHGIRKHVTGLPL